MSGSSGSGMSTPGLPPNEDFLFLDLEIPCVCRYEEFGPQEVDFLAFPEGYGIRWDTAHHPELSSLGETDAASFLQGWLFFALLNKVSHILGVDFEPSDFVQFSSTAQQWLLSGRKFRQYLCLWTAAKYHDGIDVTKGYVHDIKIYLDILNKVTNAWAGQDRVGTSGILGMVLLSLVTLGDMLKYALSKILSPSLVDQIFLEKYQWVYPEPGCARLRRAGWCDGELSVLLSQRSPTILLYLSTTNRRHGDKDHSYCSNIKGCVANQIDPRTYQTAHAVGCGEGRCQQVYAPVEAVRDILNAGGIPLVYSTGEQQLEIHTRAFSLGQKGQMPKYVAISHVWSDGMGNPRQNALHACQVGRIQRAVNGLYPASFSEFESVAFWIDTLCVPLEPKIRSLAITRMAKTFFHAEKVLVLDNWLSNGTHKLAQRDLLLSVSLSDWNTRLWTFQEAILARELRFQFRDQTLTINELEDTQFIDNLEEISEVLAKMDRKKLLKNESTLNLLRALASVDISALERIQEYASLLPQSDPDQEELRIHAIQAQKSNHRKQKYVEKWFPILAEADVVTRDPGGDRSLRAHLDNQIFDPVLAHGIDTISLLRGRSYQFAVSREADLDGGAMRQLTAFGDTSTSFLLKDTTRGLRGRLTSRLEDETICLGGIIGLDVSPLLRIAVDGRERENQVDRVSRERMKTFLSLVKYFPGSILFWESERIEHYPWKWAPVSFLDKRACLGMYTTGRAELTENGLLASFPYQGIRLTLSKHSAIQEHVRTVRLHWGGREMAEKVPNYHPSRLSWDALEMCTSNASPISNFSWYDCFSTRYDQLAVILYDESPLEGILVNILRVYQEIIYVNFLSNVRRVLGNDELERLGSYVNAEGMGLRRWCVG